MLHASVLTGERPCAAAQREQPAEHVAPTGHEHHHGDPSMAGMDVAAADAGAHAGSHGGGSRPSRSACCDLMASCALQLALPQRLELVAFTDVPASLAVVSPAPASVARSLDPPPPRA